MSIAVSAIQASGVRSGLCPHGLPPGACPICSGMGSGSNKVVTADFSAKPGEMSWNECAAIGAFLKSLQNARMAREADYQHQLVAIAQFQNNMAKMAANLQTFIQNMSQSPLTRPIAYVAQNVLLPVVNFMKDLPVKFLQMTANIGQKLADISDKLAAIYGELKAAMDKKFSDFAKKVKKKIISIFEIFSSNNESTDDEKILAYQKQLNKIQSFLEGINKELNHKYKQMVEKDVETSLSA